MLLELFSPKLNVSVFFNKGERELVLSFPLLFLVTFYTFYQLKNKKKQKVELAIKQRKMKPPLFFFFRKIFGDLQQNEKF